MRDGYSIENRRHDVRPGGDQEGAGRSGRQSALHVRKRRANVLWKEPAVHSRIVLGGPRPTSDSEWAPPEQPTTPVGGTGVVVGPGSGGEPAPFWGKLAGTIPGRLVRKRHRDRARRRRRGDRSRPTDPEVWLAPIRRLHTCRSADHRGQRTDARSNRMTPLRPECAVLETTHDLHAGRADAPDVGRDSRLTAGRARSRAPTRDQPREARRAGPTPGTAVYAARLLTRLRAHHPAAVPRSGCRPASAPQ